MEEKKWYILWSNSRKGSKSFIRMLEEYSIKVWNPCYKRINFDREEETIQLFPGYFFAFCSRKTAMFIEINCRELGNFTTKFLKDDKGIPVPLEEEEIADIEETEKREILQTVDLQIGQKVLVKGGPLSNIECIVSEIRGENVEISVKIFNRDLKMWIRSSSCIKVEK